MLKSTLGCIYKDTTTAGFQYEIIKEFADSFDYKLNIILAENTESAIKQFTGGKGDILACALPVTTAMKQKITFSTPLYTAKLVLIQKKRSKKDNALLAKNIFDLEEKNIYVPENSPYIKQLEYVMEESGTKFNIIKSSQNMEKLAEQVSSEKIAYLAVNSLTAAYLSNKNPDLDYSISLGLNQFMAWGISKKEPQMGEQLNIFIENFVKTEKYREIYVKYFS